MKTVTAIVETPKGQGFKYDYDPELGCIKLNKVMPIGLVFPFDFGYVPATTGGDGDPLDVLIISEFATFPGCAIDCRVIGAIKADQREREGSLMRNDRIIAVPEVSLQYAGINELSELRKELIDQIEAFFKNYNEQAGKTFRPLKRLNSAQAIKTLENALDPAKKDTLVQLFIPLRNEKGKQFPETYFARLGTELKERFGGVTIHNRAPVTGLWKQQEDSTVHDDLVIYEILTNSVDNGYWEKLKAKLEKQFVQTELIVLLTNTRKL